MTTPPTLRTVKEYLNIDFSDYDTFIQSALNASVDNAENFTGKKAEDFNNEVWMAILKEIGQRFDNRSGGDYTPDNSIIATYRRNSIRPMF